MQDISILLSDGYTVDSAYDYIKNRYREHRKQMEDRSRFILECCPEYAEEILGQARQFMEGKMVLCGTMGKPYFVGNPPKWSENPLGDNEFVWQLNRMEHWKTLIQAYYLTKDEEFADKVLKELENWIDTCPPLEITLDYKTAKERFSSVHPWRSLEVGIRSFGSWMNCLEGLSGNRGFTRQLFEKMVMSLYRHGEILYQVCPVIWPEANHNHYVMETLGLLEISGMLPFLKVSETWRNHGVRELERCVKNQITACGGQIEGCPTYHNECVRLLCHSLAMEGKYQFAFSKEYRKQIQSMFLYSIYSSRPDGNSVPWGDSDASPHVFEAAFQMYLIDGDKKPLKECGRLFSEEKLREEFYRHIWEVENPAELLGELENPEFFETEKPSCCFKGDGLKQIMMRTGWEKTADSLFFACRTPVHNDHAHIDPNGFDYCSHGVPVLVDAGRYNYQEGPNRRLFKGGTYHNTLQINNRNAFEYLGSWLYGEQQIGDILNSGKTESYYYVCGSHANYFPAVHTRMVLMAEGALIILDRVDNRRADDKVNIYYNFNAPQAGIWEAQQKIHGEIEGQPVCISYSDNLQCQLSRGRASSYIDHAAETTIIELDSADDSRLFMTAVLTGEENTFAEIVKMQDFIDRAEIEYQVKEKKYSITWDYKTNTIAE